MRGHEARTTTIFLNAVVIAAVATACGGGGGKPESQPSPQQSATSGAQLWAQRYDSGGSEPGQGMDQATAVALTRDGSKAIVAGSTATVAYNASSGARLWAVKVAGASVAVGADGQTVYVTGTSGSDAAADFATTALSSATGKQLWTARYDGPAKRSDNAAAVATSGDTVFVTGFSEGRGTRSDFATVAYAATTGRQLWAARYDGPSHGNESVFPAGPNTLAVSPDGTIVAVTGWSQSAGDRHDYATVAYDAKTGARLWVSRYRAAPQSDNVAGAVTISPDSRTVFVTGGSGASMAGGLDVATVAYDARTGEQRWVTRYNAPANRNDGGGAIVATANAVIVAGVSETKIVSQEDFLTLAYNPATGKRLWVTRYDGPAGTGDNAAGLAASADGSKVFVTGRSHTKPGTNVDYATVAYDTATGHQLWVSRYLGVNANNEPAAVAVTASGVVIATGTSGGSTSEDYATIAYQG